MFELEFNINWTSVIYKIVHTHTSSCSNLHRGYSLRDIRRMAALVGGKPPLPPVDGALERPCSGYEKRLVLEVDGELSEIVRVLSIMGADDAICKLAQDGVSYHLMVFAKPLCQVRIEVNPVGRADEIFAYTSDNGRLGRPIEFVCWSMRGASQYLAYLSGEARVCEIARLRWSDLGGVKLQLAARFVKVLLEYFNCPLDQRIVEPELYDVSFSVQHMGVLPPIPKNK